MTETAEQDRGEVGHLDLASPSTKVEQLTSKARPLPTRWLRASVEALNLLETRPPRAGPIVTDLGCVEDAAQRCRACWCLSGGLNVWRSCAADLEPGPLPHARSTGVNELPDCCVLACQFSLGNSGFTVNDKHRTSVDVAGGPPQAWV